MAKLGHRAQIFHDFVGLIDGAQKHQVLYRLIRYIVLSQAQHVTNRKKDIRYASELRLNQHPERMVHRRG